MEPAKKRHGRMTLGWEYRKSGKILGVTALWGFKTVMNWKDDLWMQ